MTWVGSQQCERTHRHMLDAQQMVRVGTDLPAILPTWRVEGAQVEEETRLGPTGPTGPHRRSCRGTGAGGEGRAGEADRR
ncbi:hypothetical protein GCM10010519_35090 [Streptomyces lactacystinicus]